MAAEMMEDESTQASGWFQVEAGEFSQEQPSLSLEDSVREDISKTLKERNMGFRFKAVEDVMAPLIHQVTTLTESNPMATPLSEEETKKFLLKHKQLGKPQKLVQLVDKAVRNFIAVGKDIASENPDYQEELLLACEEVHSKGERMNEAARKFIRDTSKSDKRVAMVHAARELLFGVTRLLVIADIVDVNNLLNASNRVKEKLRSLQEAEIQDETELMDKIQACTSDITQITQMATLQLNAIKSKTSLQMLAAAQTELNQASQMLVSASKAFLHSPAVKAAEENREFIIEGMLRSLKTLTLFVDGEDPWNMEGGRSESGELATSFANFEANLDKIASGFSPKVVTVLKKELEVILKATADLAVSSCTRDYRQHSIINKSRDLKAGLQCVILSAKDGDKENKRESMSITRECSASLKCELQRICADHISDGFVKVFGPLKALVKVAQEGDRGVVDKVAEKFEEHAKIMLKAAGISCSLCVDADSAQMVTLAARHVRTLTPQVIRAAQTLAVQPLSDVLQKNMSVFREAWIENVTLLTNSVDAIAPLLDFMVITEAHMHEDGHNLVEAAESGNKESFEWNLQLMYGRCKRFTHMIKAEVRENAPHYSPDQKKELTDKIHKVEKKSLVTFYDSAVKIRDKLTRVKVDTKDLKPLQEFSGKVIEDVRSLCRLFLITRSLEEQERVGPELEDLPHPLRPQTSTPLVLSQVSINSQTSLDSSLTQTPKIFQRTPQHSVIFDAKDSTQMMMTQLSVAQQAQLAKVTADLSIQQEEFEKEVKKWDGENDMVLLAKEMCMMMMDMSNFTRGIGPLHTMADLTIVCKDLVRAGECLCTLTRVIADQCPDAKYRNDLYAYMDRMKLHCHQLKITAAVKADFKNTTVETVDSASALITAGKNLMTAVVETVKTSYIASETIARLHGGSMPDQFTQWRLTLPRKKNLETSPAVKSEVAPIHELGLFKPGRPKGEFL